MAVLIDDKGNQIPIHRTKRPRMSYHRGATWDAQPRKIDGKDVDFYLETSWGRYSYFYFGSQWYKVDCDEIGWGDEKYGFTFKGRKKTR